MNRKAISRMMLTLLLMSGSALTLKVLAEEDLTPPVLQTVKIEPDTVHAGDSLTIYVYATDNLSGLKYVSVHWRSPSGVQAGGSMLWNVASDGAWYETISISQYAEGGTWIIDLVGLTDNAMNTAYFHDVATFEVIPSTPDITPPVLVGVRLEPNVVPVGTSSTVYVNVYDDTSGIQYVSVHWRSPSGAQAGGANIWSIAPTGEWYGSIDIPLLAEEGTWVVDLVGLTDYAGNSAYFHDVITFEVTATESDVTPPLLQNVKLEPDYVVAGGSLTIYVYATDDMSGLKYVSVHWRSPSGAQAGGANIWNVAPDGAWCGTITIPMYAERGTWIVDMIGLTDNAMNTAYYYNVASFVVADLGISINVEPGIFNLRSEGRWITAYFQLPEGYNPEDIDAATILLVDTIPPVLDPKYDFVTNSSEYLVDHNDDGILERMVKFNRTEVASWIHDDLGIEHGNVTLTITGELYDETPFEGSDVIRVLFPGDVNDDGSVDPTDFSIFAGCYGMSIEHPGYDVRADFNQDGYINPEDFSILSANYGKTAN